MKGGNREEEEQKKRDRKHWEREFLTHEFNSQGKWVPKEWEDIKQVLVKKKKAKNVFTPPGALTPAQQRRSCINREAARAKLRAVARWKKRWNYDDPTDLTKAFTE